MGQTSLKEKKFKVYYTLKDGSSLSNVVPAKTKEEAISEVKNMWYGYNPQIQSVKIEK